MSATNLQAQIWDESIPFYWVVICKNRKFHHQLSRQYSHIIPLAETDALEPVPELGGKFTVRCDECGKESVYKPTDVLRFQLELPNSFTPHALFE